YCIQLECNKTKASCSNRYKDIASTTIEALLTAASENCTTIADSLDETLIKLVSSDKEDEALTALDFTTYLTWGGRIRWESVSNHIFDTCSIRVETLSRKYFSVCYYAVLHEKVHIFDFIRWYNFASLFKSVDIAFLNGYHIPSLIDTLTINIFYHLSGEVSICYDYRFVPIILD